RTYPVAQLFNGAAERRIGRDAGEPPIPASIGGYPVERLLGAGGFGRVYLAHDVKLDRLGAIKVPPEQIGLPPENSRAHLKEARITASLDHPNVVRVIHVGNTTNHPFYVVSMFIEGGSLATKLQEALRPGWQWAAGLVATVAGALQYVHSQRIYHRDIKP